MKLIISTAARADLAAIEDYIAADNPARAASFVDELVDRCEDLATQPERFPLVAPFRRAGIRRRPYRGYLIFYRIAGDVVEVLRVIFGARQWERLLGPQDDRAD
jgi:plasmid stabilization system protein ParE